MGAPGTDLGDYGAVVEKKAEEVKTEAPATEAVTPAPTEAPKEEANG